MQVFTERRYGGVYGFGSMGFQLNITADDYNPSRCEEHKGQRSDGRGTQEIPPPHINASFRVFSGQFKQLRVNLTLEIDHVNKTSHMQT